MPPAFALALAPIPARRRPRRWTTLAQRAAARANGRKSSGPVTAEGKARSAENSKCNALYTPPDDLSFIPGFHETFAQWLSEYPENPSTVASLHRAIFLKRYYRHLGDSLLNLALKTNATLSAAYADLDAEGISMDRIETLFLREGNRTLRLIEKLEANRRSRQP